MLVNPSKLIINSPYTHFVSSMSRSWEEDFNRNNALSQHDLYVHALATKSFSRSNEIDNLIRFIWPRPGTRTPDDVNKTWLQAYLFQGNSSLFKRSVASPFPKKGDKCNTLTTIKFFFRIKLGTKHP